MRRINVPLSLHQDWRIKKSVSANVLIFASRKILARNERRDLSELACAIRACYTCAIIDLHTTQVDIVAACCSMGVWESEIRFRYARSTALVCRARRNSCFPLTLSAAVASLESPRERRHRGSTRTEKSEFSYLSYISTYSSLRLVSFRLPPRRARLSICHFYLSSLGLLVKKRRYFIRQLLLDRSDCSEPSDPVLFLLIKF